MELTITEQQYEALVHLAREGARLKCFLEAAEGNPKYAALVAGARAYSAASVGSVLALEEFLKEMELQNGIVRRFLAIRWQETAAPLPPRVAGRATRWPDNWPPELDGTIERIGAPITKREVGDWIQNHAKRPSVVMVTSDPARRVGWSSLESFFVD